MVLLLVALSSFTAVGWAETKENLSENNAAAVEAQSSEIDTTGNQPNSVEADNKEPNLLAFSLEELMKMSVVSAATLMQTKHRLVPAAVTTIDQEMIQHSGARSLNELFDIFVPNSQIMRHHTRSDLLGIRGIINVPEDKYLLLVNGHLMNLRSTEGVVTERDLPMLADVHHVNVVRGPGSVVYGPGAVSGVIDIVTYNGLTFEGTDVRIRQGFVERFSSFEIRHGHRIDDEEGLFLYYGLDDYTGADQDDAPYIFSKSFATNTGHRVLAGEPADFGIVDDHAAFRFDPEHKLHLHYTRESISGRSDAWIRFTRSGEQVADTLATLSPPPLGFGIPGEQDDHGTGHGYQQLTVQASHIHELSDTLSMDLRIGFDLADDEMIYRPVTPFAFLNKSSRESELNARILAR